jgi:hypothetical protein
VGESDLVTRDTVIQGHYCREVQAHGCTFCGTNQGICFVYSDNNQVFYYIEEIQEFALLYDLNKNPTEGWEIPYYDTYSEFEGMDTLSVVVEDTTSIYANGIRLKQQYVLIDGTSFSPFFWGGNQITERIGAYYSFFPINNGFCDAGLDGIRCYEDSTLGLFHMTTNDCEWSTVGINKVKNETYITASPNPCNSQLEVSIGRSLLGTGQIRIINHVGSTVFESSATEHSITIDVSRLSEGIYYFQLSSIENQVYSTSLSIIH